MSRRMMGRVLVAAAILPVLAMPAKLHAHCDTMDGPVVKAAQRALESGAVEHALVWVQAEHETEVREVFDHVRRVRTLGAEVAALADRHFLETVVRLHREGEGEPYTGLKPAGAGVAPGVLQADAALEAGSIDGLRRHLHHLLVERLDAAFADAARQRNAAGYGSGASSEVQPSGAAADAGSAPDVHAGREYVAAYVRLMHLVEELEAVLSGHDHGSADGVAGRREHDAHTH